MIVRTRTHACAEVWEAICAGRTCVVQKQAFPYPFIPVDSTYTAQQIDALITCEEGYTLRGNIFEPTTLNAKPMDAGYWG